MAEVVLVSRIVLGAVFVAAAIAKVVQGRRFVETTAELGIPVPVARGVARLVPLLELGIGALLLPARTAVAGAAAAITLLSAFTLLLVVNLARGRRPGCNCFGALSSRPISAWSVLRNLVLIAVGFGVIAGGGGTSLSAAVRGVGVVELLAVGWSIGLTAVVAAQTSMLTRLLRQHGKLLLRVDALEHPESTAVDAGSGPGTSGLPVGTEAPEFALAGLHGETMTLAALRTTGRPIVLLFSDPGCGPCTTLSPRVAEWQRQHGDKLRLVVVATGSLEANRAKSAEHGLVDVLLDASGEVASAYLFQGTPGAVLVDLSGRVASPLATGAIEIEKLVDLATGTVPVRLTEKPHDHDHHHHHHDEVQPERLGLEVGSDAPTFTLPTVGGGEASNAEFRGRPVVLLFWNPRCGFCESLLPELLAWERDRGPSAPELLIVSTGDEAANARLGFSSTVTLDAASTTMELYGVTGTPMAVRIDGEGRIASAVGIGAPGVRELLHVSVEEVQR